VELNISVKPWGVAMFNRKLDKAEWESFFNFLSKQLEGKLAEIEIASLKVGDQIEAEWLPLVGIAYDPKDDIVEIALEDHDHIINKPREIYFAEEGTQFMGLDILDGEGAHQIVKLRDPLMLASREQ
jgi:hypothetical protein